MANPVSTPPCAVAVPREGASDDVAALVEIMAPQGNVVVQGQVLCVCETSKTAFEVVAPCDGHVHWVHGPGDRVPVGEPCGWVLAQPLDDAGFALWLAGQAPATEAEAVPEAASSAAPLTAALPSGVPSTSPERPRLSQAAQALAAKHGLDPAALCATGLVTAADVQAGIAAASVGSARFAAPGTGNQVVIIGGGGHAKMFIDILKAQSALRMVGIVDTRLAPGCTVLGVPVLGDMSLLPALYARGVRQAVLGVGAARHHALRSTLFRQLLDLGFDLPNIVHPRACVEPSASMGRGNLVMAQAYVGSAVKMGDNCIVNSGSIVSHDCTLHDNVHLAPGSVLAGGVQVDRDTLVGMNCSVYMQVRIGARVTVANQASVLADVPDDGFIRP